jgi:hypothetical protein
MREQLERCRASGLVEDERRTRYGVRHELFGTVDLRFVAEARFAIDLEEGEEIDEVGFGIVDLEHGEEPPEDD